MRRWTLERRDLGPFSLARPVGIVGGSRGRTAAHRRRSVMELTSTPSSPARSSSTSTGVDRHGPAGRLLVGGLFLTTGGVHLGLVAADPEVYRHFADAGIFPFVRDGWRSVV